MKKTLRLGTRGSPLALLQAEEVRKNLLAAHGGAPSDFELEIVPIRTGGDWRSGQPESSFRELGGSKELFTKEIEEALEGGYVDMAVHSMKDVSSHLPPNLAIAAMLARVDPRDAFISPNARDIRDLPQGARVGTSSLRRQAQVLACRPDLKVVPLRGNVETRLQKLKDGKAEATILALAGLIRLGLQNLASSAIDTETMLPAAAQGVIGVQVRRDDHDMFELLRAVNVTETSLCVTAERAMLRVLDGSCHTPIGALATFTGPDEITLHGMAAQPNGANSIRHSLNGAAKDAEKIGAELGTKMRTLLPANFYAA